MIDSCKDWNTFEGKIPKIDSIFQTQEGHAFSMFQLLLVDAGLVFRKSYWEHGYFKV